MAVTLEEEIAEVDDDDAVDEEDHRSGEGGVFIIVGEFDGHVNAGGEDGEPLGPGVLMPEAIALRKPDDGQGEGDCSSHAEAGVGDFFGFLHQEPAETPGGIQVEGF